MFITSISLNTTSCNFGDVCVSYGNVCFNNADCLKIKIVTLIYKLYVLYYTSTSVCVFIILLSLKIVYDKRIIIHDTDRHCGRNKFITRIFEVSTVEILFLCIFSIPKHCCQRSGSSLKIL